jgi:cytochrome c556
MTKKELIALYLSLFAGRPDVYAFRQEWQQKEEDGSTVNKAAYIPSNYDGSKDSVKEQVRKIAENLGTYHYDDLAVDAHICGKQFLGVYPLHEDSTVKFAALDFDGESPEEAWSEAHRHYVQLREQAGLPCYIERSQSGNGFHIWMFFEEAIDAGIVRKAIKSFINKSDVYDRMFPNQSRVSEHKPLGNLIALPLFAPKVKEGNNTFVIPAEDYEGNAKPKVVSDVKEFLSKIERIPKATVETLAANAPEAASDDYDVKIREGAASGDQPGVKKLLDARFGCNWVRWMIENPEEVDEPNWYALACNLALLRGGREAFHEISAHSTRYSPRDTDKKFDQAVEKNAPQSCEYIRESLSGPGCDCDKRFPGKCYRPADLAKIPVFDLIKDVKGEDSIDDATSGITQVFSWAQSVEKDPLLGTGHPYGISSLDEFTGLRNATLNILAARPSVGKTALALDVAYRAAESGIPVYFFSLEMSRQQLWRRLICRAASVNLTKMIKGQLTPQDWEKLEAAQKDISDRNFPLFVDDSSRDIRKIMDTAWDLIEQHGPGIVIVDYLGLLDWYKGEQEYAGTTRNSKESKLLAKALNIPVLMLHQFNRQGDDMSIGAETFDAWLRSSGQIEQDADVILYILGDKGPGIKEREIVIQKERDREAGHRIILEFDPSCMTFYPAGTKFSLNNTIMAQTVAVSADDASVPWEG